MKQLLYALSIIIIAELTFQSCANPGRPTGGPKDTIPPTLTYANPKNGTINFTGTTLELEFDEFVNTDKLKQQLIITPQTDINYKSIAKRNKVIIKFEENLQDSTTYNFNFGNGVTDITEKNPAVNLSIALSTGPFIDSMSLNGTIQQLLTKEPGESYVLGLYPLSDSLDYFTDKPMYFTTADQQGNYALNYVKKGTYKVLAFEDDNGNFLLDPETEPHGFLAQDLILDSVTTLPSIRCLLQNIKPLSLINARPTGPYVEVKFNKTIDTYSLIPWRSSNIIGENKDVIRLYKSPNIDYLDSITTYIKASDSLGNSITDTLKYTFIQSNRKPSSFSYSFGENNVEIQDSPTVKLKFNKPIQTFDTTKLTIQSDSIVLLNPSFSYIWNFNKTELDLQFDLQEQQFDSLIAFVSIDTISQDSIKTLSASPKTPSLTLHALKGAFLSVESDTSSENSIRINKPSKKSTGVLKVSLTTDNTSFIFQLLTDKNQVAYQKIDEKDFTLSSIKPGKYKIRVLIDNNSDGKWSYGNLLANEEPEEVFIYEESTSVRENWVIELSITF